MIRLAPVALLIAACAAPTPTPSPTSAPSPIPTPSLPIPPEGYRILPPPGTELQPGHYLMSGFEPTVGFEVAEGWTTVQQFQGFFDIQDDPGSLDVVAIQFANLAGNLEEVVDDVMGRPNTRVIENDESRLGGLVGRVLVIETTDPPDSQPPIFRPVLDLAPGPLSIASGRRLWLSLLPVSDSILAVMVGGSIAEWDRALELAEPVLESVVVSE